MKSSGKGAVILPHGVLFRGGAEGGIRKNLIQRGVIQGIIGLPANLFYGTGIPACIIVLDKAHATGRKGIFLIDAAKGFQKNGNKNRLRQRDIHKIVDAFARQAELPGYARMVSHAEIADNDYNLNLPRYIDSSSPEDLQDIAAHLRGGIPDADIDRLQAYWDVLPLIRAILFAPERPGYRRLQVDSSQIKATIFAHPAFNAFHQQINMLFSQWQAAQRPLLGAIRIGDRPKALIHTLAESLLDTFRSSALIDPYAIYQQLMDYWAETLQDDVWILVMEGWRAVLNGSPNLDLIPKDLIIARTFATEQQAIEQMEAERDALTRQMEELDEEHGGEEGLLNEARTDKGRLTAKSVKDRIRAIQGDTDAGEERAVLTDYVALLDQE